LNYVKFIIKRILFLLLLLLGVATCVFILSKMVPGDGVSAYLSPRSLANEEIVKTFKAEWGLNKSLIVQYVMYMKNLLQGNLGKSIRTGNTVIEELKRYYPATFELAFLSILLATIFGVFFGIISATKRNSMIDQSLRAVSVTGVSVPSFWFAILALYVFYYKLGWAPGTGRLSIGIEAPQHITGLYVLDGLLTGNFTAMLDSLFHLVLPSIVLASFAMGLITRTTRASLLETLSTDYIRTAHAKGVSALPIIFRHAMGNAAIPVLTVIGVGFGNLLGGMVVVETIFAWPGVGQFAFQSVKSLDFPAIIGVSLLIAVNYAIINIIIDILYGVIDPRVRDSSR
jgi:peptide/nickel transport system permease protein